MPKVNHDFRGKKPPRLQVLKNERTLLATAARLCDTIAHLVEGLHPELADNTTKLAKGLQELAAVAEHDLSKPF